MKVHELGHIVLYVRNLDRSRAFYEDLLGWEIVAEQPGSLVMYSTGRTHHELFLIEVGEDAQPIPNGRRVGMYHFGIKIGDSDDELRSAHKQLKAAGVPIVGLRDHTVTHSIYVLDPDENEVELYIDVQPPIWRQNPAAVLGAKPLEL